MIAVNTRSGYRAAIISDYIVTSQTCLLMFYKMMGSAGILRLSVYLIDEEKNEIPVEELELTADGLGQWLPLYVYLPTGLHQIVIQGMRVNGSVGISLDDIKFGQCRDFSKHSILIVNYVITYVNHHGVELYGLI